MRLSRVISAAIISLLDRLYIKPLRGLISATIFRYAVCGVANYFILDTLLYYLIYHYIIPSPLIVVCGVAVSSHIASMVLLFPITLLNGFWLNRHVAFRAESLPVGRQLLIYIGTIFGSLALSYVAMKLLVEMLGVWATPSKLITSVITSLYSYLMARFVTFKS
ncbi:MAG: GtrA family protein [Rikenellaceae bacterium]